MSMMISEPEKQLVEDLTRAQWHVLGAALRAQRHEASMPRAFSLAAQSVVRPGTPLVLEAARALRAGVGLPEHATIWARHAHARGSVFFLNLEGYACMDGGGPTVTGVTLIDAASGQRTHDAPLGDDADRNVVDDPGAEAQLDAVLHAIGTSMILYPETRFANSLQWLNYSPSEVALLRALDEEVPDDAFSRCHRAFFGAEVPSSCTADQAVQLWQTILRGPELWASYVPTPVRTLAPWVYRDRKVYGDRMVVTALDLHPWDGTPSASTLTFPHHITAQIRTTTPRKEKNSWQATPSSRSLVTSLQTPNCGSLLPAQP